MAFSKILHTRLDYPQYHEGTSYITTISFVTTPVRCAITQRTSTRKHAQSIESKMRTCIEERRPIAAPCYTLAMPEIEGHVIQNFDSLAVTPARTSLLSIAEAGFQAIQTPTVVRNAVRLSGNKLMVHGAEFDLSEYEHLYILGVGKCSIDAALELEAILGERITEGVVLDVRGTDALTRIKALEGSHPYPTNENAQHTAELLTLAKKATEHDLVLAVISGGGSTLLCQPETHTCADEASLVRHLFKKGATIEELNTVRKHLSRARGGHIAAATHPAQLVTMIFSDVPGDDLHTIASAPTVLDESTLEDAKRVFDMYGASASFSVEHLFETPKDTEKFSRVRNELVVTNRTALDAMKARAEELGYTAEICDTELQGEAKEVADMIVKKLHDSKERSVLLYGGETTVTITGPGKGGRNEELSAAALPLINDDELVLSIASDGRDNTDVAGGIADAHTREQAHVRGLNAEDFLFTNDTFSFFHTLQQGVETGYTGANVADLVIAMKHGSS